MELKINGNADLVLTIPGREGKRGHSVIIPVSIEGLRVLKQILMADKRERETGGTPSFATEAAPTQEMVNAFLRTHSPKRAPAIKPKPEFVLPLNLDLDF